MGYFDYTDPETLSNYIAWISITVLIAYIWATLRNRRDSRVKAKSRIDKLLTMGETSALADIIANATDKYICRLAAEALMELGDERSKKLLDSPIGEGLATTPDSVAYGLGIRGLRLLTTIGIFFITWLVFWGLATLFVAWTSSLFSTPGTDGVAASIRWSFIILFASSPLVAGYIAYRWVWRNNYFISE